MKFTELLKQIIMSQSGYSSKRFCGMIGWISCMIIIIYCTLYKIQAPMAFDIFTISTVTLLGVDSVTGMFKNKDKNNNN